MKCLFSLLVVMCVAVGSLHSNGIQPDGQGKRVLALLDSYALRETHSTFFKSLRDRGFQVNFKTADDSDLTLSRYNEYLYDHVILFCPNVVEFGGNVTSKTIVDFIDAGGNVLVAASSQLTEPVKEVAGECGVEFSDEGTYVIDRFNSAVNDDGHGTLIVSEPGNLINNKLIVGESTRTGSPFIYRGVGMSVDPENPLLIEILSGSSTSYTYKPSDQIVDYPQTVGKNTLLISALQARNNARVLFVGSLDFFSNEFFESSVEKNAENSKRSEKSGNEALSVALTQWLFKERGVLRVVSVKHHEVGHSAPPAAYTIKQDIVYTIRIEEMREGRWQPFQGSDVQLEFIRLDPFVRTTLKSTGSTGNLEARFQLPDVYGIFKFNVDYKRLGYTYLYSSTQMSVRPLEHTQYDRFIPAAFPYYVSSFGMMIGVVLFSFIQLYHHDAPVAAAK